jgi:predicted phage-related endonuclease
MLDILNIEQGTDEWLRARAGIVTASRLKDVMAKGEGKTRKKYMHELAGEIITGQPMETFKSAHMDRGHEQEPEARDLYSFIRDVDPVQVGFIRDGRVGCSPDALIGDDGALEIKTQLPHLMVETITGDRFLPQHVKQCQGVLMVTGRAWIDLVVYSPGFPLFIKRAERDEDLISGMREGVESFLVDLDKAIETVRAYGKAA